MKDAIIALLLVLLALAVMLDGGRQDMAQAAVVRADYSRCVTVRNAPLNRSRGVRLYPNRSELS